LLSPPSQLLHAKRLKNRERLQHQLDRKRAEKQQAEFVARFSSSTRLVSVLDLPGV